MIKKITNKFFNIFEVKKKEIFYKQIVNKNDLIFDIGANHGNRTSIFLKIGTKVVAVEPNPQLAINLIKRFGRKVKVIQKAVGNTMGKVDLFINDADVLSTTSIRWMETVKISGRFGGLADMFNRKVEVELLTLNMLFKECGLPKFIKIDTEGLELDIIKTLENTDIYSLSFEFAIPETLDDTLSAINHLETIGYHYYNISFAETMEFLTNKKLNKNEIKKLLKNLPAMTWGDVYVFSK